MSIATETGTNPDTYLMTVAVAASCAFLTPIGHKNNTIIMGPGGYQFGDYWRIGLPLEASVVCVAVPTILYFWPLSVDIEAAIGPGRTLTKRLYTEFIAARVCCVELNSPAPPERPLQTIAASGEQANTLKPIERNTL